MVMVKLMGGSSITALSRGIAKDLAKEMIRRKTVGWGSLGALEKARRARAETWERVRHVQEDGVMGRREAEEARQGAATLVQQAWSGGYKRACEVGGAIFVPMALTPYGGWHKERRIRTWRSPGLVTQHIRATGWGITSLTRGSNILGEPGRA